MNTKESNIYSEHFYPWFLPLTFFLPWFWKYGVVVGEDAITFGYGISGPTKRGLCSHTISFQDIKKSSVSTGCASITDNLLQFGGWGIRFSFRDKIWAYNASLSGPYLELVEQHGENMTKYRIATQNPDLVASIIVKTNNGLRQETKKYQ